MQLEANGADKRRTVKRLTRRSPKLLVCAHPVAPGLWRISMFQCRSLAISKSLRDSCVSLNSHKPCIDSEKRHAARYAAARTRDATSDSRGWTIHTSSGCTSGTKGIALSLNGHHLRPSCISQSSAFHRKMQSPPSLRSSKIYLVMDAIKDAALRSCGRVFFWPSRLEPVWGF